MLTTGENISAIIRYFIATSQVNDRELREKTLFFMQEGGERLWTMAPVWWRLGDGSVSVTANTEDATMPSDFAQFGAEGHLYVNGQPGRPALRYVDPAVVAARLQSLQNNATYPECYTLASRTTAGLARIKLAPKTLGSVTLDAKRYVRRAPFLIDTAAPPKLTTGVANPAAVDIGTHYYRITFTGAGGVETEGGPISLASTLTVESEVSLTDIPTSPVWTVTGRNIYRTAAADPNTFLLLTSIADNTTTTYTDTTPDASLGATSPPVPSTAVGTGMEQFPEDWQKSLVYEYAKLMVAQAQGDVRDRAWLEDWLKEVRRMWGELKQGQNFPRYLPRYGQKNPIGRYPSAIDRLRTANQ